MLLRYHLRNFTTSKSFATILTTHRQLFTGTTANNMSNRAAFVESAKGQVVVRDAETIQPEAKEVLIKVQACAIQPADSKIAKLAIMPWNTPPCSAVRLQALSKHLELMLLKLRWVIGSCAGPKSL